MMSTIFNHMQYEAPENGNQRSKALQTARRPQTDILMIGVHLEGQSDGVELRTKLIKS
jgi:hypothetical protein